MKGTVWAALNAKPLLETIDGTMFGLDLNDVRYLGG